MNNVHHIYCLIKLYIAIRSADLQHTVLLFVSSNRFLLSSEVYRMNDANAQKTNKNRENGKSHRTDKNT